MNSAIEHFHFLRPEWLWALLPAAVLLGVLMRRGASSGQDNWQRYIDAHLLAHLSMRGSATVSRRKPWLVAALVIGILITGLAGPSWEKAETPSFNGGEPVVAVLSLAQSMNGDDIAPSRLKRAIHKLRDLLAATQGNDRSLVIYSDIPFVAAPLTRDTRVIEQMLPELSTGLMPVLGDRLDLAIDEASQLLQRTAARSGQIILLTDSIGDRPQASLQAAEAARANGYDVSVLAVGTPAGARLQTADGQIISDRDGAAYVSKLPLQALQQLARKGGGSVAVITPDSSDLQQLLPADIQPVSAGRNSDIRADSWVDNGYWLLLLPVLVAPLLFRRGLVFGLVFMLGVAGFQPKTALAENAAPASENSQGVGASSGWSNLWQTPDQQGSDAFAADDFSTAASTFESPDWQATALYRAGDYQAAAREYASLSATDKDYNLGNALAKGGDFRGALDAYERFLARSPDHENAIFNRDLVAKLLEQQQQQQQQQQDQQDQQDQQSGSGSEEQKDQQSGSGSEEQKDQQDQQDQQSGSGSEEQKDQQSGSDSEDQKGQPDQQSQQSGSGSEDQKGQQGQESGSGAESGREQQDQPAQQASAEEQQGPRGESSEEQSSSEYSASEHAHDDKARQEDDSGFLSQLISDALQGNQDASPEQRPDAEPVSGSVQGQPLDQASEQQLRRVPDDPTGLLRARIRQHYAQLRAMQ